ncbi:MAG: LptA/OstA family protein, partial [Terriglobales bacterium]
TRKRHHLANRGKQRGRGRVDVLGDPERFELRFAGAGAAPAQLASALARGGVEMDQGARSLTAQSLQYDAASGTAVCTGGVVAADAQTRLSAPQMTFTSRPDGNDRLAASQGVAVSLLPGAGGGLLPAGNAGQPVTVTAERLNWQGNLRGEAASRGTAEFNGGVRVMQAPNLLRADQLRLEAAANRMVAAGGVVTSTVSSSAVGGRAGARSRTPSVVTVSAAKLSYDATRRLAVYQCGVELRGAEAQLQAPQMVVQMGARGLEQVVASQGVRLQQLGRSGSANQVSYQVAQGLIRMSGGTPSIYDAEQGKISGDPLTFSLASDEIQVGSKSGVRALGQTVVHK